MSTYIIIKMHCKTQKTGFTRRFYCVHAACPQCAHGALEDPTVLPQHPHSALSTTLCKLQAVSFVLSMVKINAATWHFRPLHRVFTTFLECCWRLHSAHLRDLQRFLTLWKRCEDAALVWQGFEVRIFISQWTHCATYIWVAISTP